MQTKKFSLLQPVYQVKMIDNTIKTKTQRKISIKYYKIKLSYITKL